MRFSWAIEIPLVLVACVTTEMAQEADQPDSGRMVRQADGQFARRAYAQALETYKLAAVAANANGEDESLVHAYSGAAHALIALGRVSESVPWLDGATGKASSDEPAAWSRFLLARGAYEHAVGKDAMATVTFAEMYSYCMDRQRYADAMRAAHMATLVTLAAPAERIDWGMRGIAAARSTGDQLWLAASWTSFAWLLEDEGRYAQSLKAFRSAREFHETAGDEHGLLVSDWSIAHSLRVAGHLPEARKQIEPTLAWAERRYSKSRTRNDAEWLGRCLLEYAEVALAQGNPKVALERFVSARSRLIEAGIAQAAPASLLELDGRIATASAALAAADPK